VAPNHVLNYLKFKIKKPDDAYYILNRIASQFDDNLYHIDFNKIISEPKTKEECPDWALVDVTSHISIREDKPWFNWYKWHLEIWGTKWNAYDSYTKIGKSYITFVFQTAWTSPTPIINKLADLGFDIIYKYADEDYGHNCGVKEYYVDKDYWDTSTEEDYENPKKFSKNLWDRY
jgi:hypothetical protein